MHSSDYLHLALHDAHAYVSYADRENARHLAELPPSPARGWLRAIQTWLATTPISAPEFPRVTVFPVGHVTMTV